MSNTLAKQFASQLLESQGSVVSVESAIVDNTDYDPTGNLEDLMEITADVDDIMLDVDQGIRAEEGLTGLVEGLFEIYGEDGVDETAAKLYQTSVEALLRVSNLNVPASLLVPAFESNAQYSAEVQDRSRNFVTRILAWIVNAIKRLKDAIGRFWQNVQTNVKKLQAYAKRVQAKVNAIPANRRITKTGELTLTSSALWLSDRNGQVRDPFTQVTETITRYDDFLISWEDRWKGMFERPAEGSGADQIVAKFETMMHTATNVQGFKMDISPTHYLEYTPGPRERAALDAKIEIKTDVSDGHKTAPTLSWQEMHDGIDLIVRSFSEVERLKKIVDTYAKASEKLEKFLKSTAGGGVSSYASANAKVDTKVITKAVGLAAWGFTHPTSYYLRTIRTCIRYIDVSADRY